MTTKTRYTSRLVHKIAPSDNDTGNPVELSSSDFATRGTLAAALRNARILPSGGRVTNYRIETDNTIVVFPSVPGMTTFWHAIILTPAEPCAASENGMTQCDADHVRRGVACGACVPESK